MAKYSFELKKQIVMEYLKGGVSYNFLARKYEMKDSSIIKRWTAVYREKGDSGLMRSRENKDYSFLKKISVVEMYLTSELSYQEIAISEGISNPGLIACWVNKFRTSGPDGLRPKRKTVNKEENVDSEIENKKEKSRIQELEKELLELKIENAFLKELRRLRLEDEKKMRERL